MSLNLHNIAFNSATHFITNGLVAWWKFDDGSGKAIADSSGFHNTASMSTSQWTQGKIGGGLLFTGSSASNFGTSSAINISTGAITITGWMNSQWSNLGVLNSFPFITETTNYGSGNGIALTITTGKFVDWDFNQISCFGNGYGSSAQVPRGLAYIPASITSSLNGWHHIAGVLSATKVQIYVDGVPLTMQTASVAAVPSNNYNFAIGGNPGVTNDFLGSGSLDDVRIYNRALGASEIYQIANILG